MKYDRHIGKIKTTEQRILVVMPDIGNNKCLIVDLDSLPDFYSDMMERLIFTSEVQETADIADYLSKRTTENGKTILQTLHDNNLLRSESIDMVLLTPTPANHVPLRDVVDSMNTIKNQEATRRDFAQGNRATSDHIKDSLEEDNRSIAQALMYEAAMLEQDAQRKRESAYEYDPTLRPVVEEKTEKVVEEKTTKKPKVEKTPKVEKDTNEAKEAKA